MKASGKANVRLRLASQIAAAVTLYVASCAIVGPAAQAHRQAEGVGQRLAQTAQKEPAMSTEVRARIREAAQSVGLVLVRNAADPANSAPRPRGSAVVVHSDGIVATNFHVIAESKTNRLYDEIYFNLSPGGPVDPATSKHHRLRVILINRTLDLALLRVEAAGDNRGNNSADSRPPSAPLVFPAIQIGDSRNAQLLDDLFIIGFPEKGGLSVTVNHGVVEGKDILDHWIKTNARIIHGNSGGAAVGSDGKLIGIPTRVVADSQPLDKDGDGFPDASRFYGAVGFLRPAYLIAAMLTEVGTKQSGEYNVMGDPQSLAQPSVTVSGIVRSLTDRKPIAGALVGVLPLGTESVTEATLLTWGGTNSEGRFVLRKPLPPGRYTIKAKALGYEAYTGVIEISQASPRVDIELRAASDR